MTFLLYALARHPQDTEKIFLELSHVDPADLKAISQLPHLNGAILETLRLYSVTPTIVTRLTPREGIMIGGTYIPGETKVWAPRWTTGKRQARCVGQDLARMQLRLVLASVVKRFRFEFEGKDRGEAVLRDMRDQLTSQPGALKLVFRHRETVEGQMV
ncbi:MAG: hypothetical protein Q9159_001187 [Coniocarpon cinnabarinum]